MTRPGLKREFGDAGSTFWLKPGEDFSSFLSSPREGEESPASKEDPEVYPDSFQLSEPADIPGDTRSASFSHV